MQKEKHTKPECNIPFSLNECVYNPVVPQVGKKGEVRSPFHRGVWRNLQDLLGWSCFGLFHPDRTDWLRTYTLTETTEDKQPLLAQSDMYQYV